MAKQAKTTRSPRFTNSYLNLIIGIIVVVAIAGVVIGLIRSRATPQIADNQEQAGQEEQASQNANLPTKHKVAAGEDLWKISEKYYKTGYNWTDIAKKNNIANPNDIAEGMEIIIPNVTPKASETATATPVVPTSTLAPTTVASTTAPTPVPSVTLKPEKQSRAITAGTYTVVAGDYLWEIAIRAYGDGYKWVEIARANKLVNPDIIHPGNVLTLPH